MIINHSETGSSLNPSANLEGPVIQAVAHHADIIKQKIILLITLCRKTSVSLEDVSGYLDETVVDEEFIMTQLTGNDASESDSDVDEELVDILADLAVDAKKDLEPPTDSDDIFKTPKSNKCSQNSQLSARKLSKYVSEALAEEEDAESLEMSQAVWETEGDWADLDRTLMENLAANLNDCDDMEDMFKK